MSERPQDKSLTEHVRREWERSPGPPGIREVLSAVPPFTKDDAADACVADAEIRWERGFDARLEDYVREVPELVGDRGVRQAILMVECARRVGQDQEAMRRELAARLPEDRELIDEVLELIALMSAGKVEQREGAGAALAPGMVLGKYELLEILGCGSFGEVWRAWDQKLERYVALKMLPPMDSDEAAEATLDRVLAEAQAAAALDHENIVKVHDAGRLGPEGRYFIDSQLAGDPDPTTEDRKRVKVAPTLSAMMIGAGGEARAMSPKRAAELVRGVCLGIAAAHARGIVHRDIKPSNILVTASGRPLVTDFGLSTYARPSAHAADEPATTTVSIAVGGGRITGTPAFMSPEQARGERATPASDVYALGATLRYVLVGTLPFRASGRYGADGRWDIIEQVKRREIRPLLDERPDLPRDLAAICEKAMSAEPAARYVSAQQMGEDLGAFLAHRPVIARKVGVARRAGLWCVRHAGVTTVAGAAIIVGAFGTWRYVDSVGKERDRAVVAERLAIRRYNEAQDALTTSQAVNGFLQSILASAQARNQGSNVTVVEATRLAGREAERQFAGRPLVEAEVRMTLGRTFRGLGELKEARPHVETAWDIRKAQLGEDDPSTLEAERELAMIERFEGKLKEAEARGSNVLARLVGVVGEGSLMAADAMGEVAVLKRSVGKGAEGAELLEKSIAVRTREQGPEHPKTLVDRVRYSEMLMQQNRTEEALKIALEVYPIQRRILGDDQLDTISTMNDIGAYYGLLKNYEANVEWATKSLDAGSRLLPKGHRSLYLVAMGIAESLDSKLKRSQDALEVFLPQFEAFAEKAGMDDPNVANGRAVLGGVYANLKRFEEAEGHLLAAREHLLKREGPIGPWMQLVYGKLVRLYKAWEKPAEVAKYQKLFDESKPKKPVEGSK